MREFHRDRLKAIGSPEQATGCPRLTGMPRLLDTADTEGRISLDEASYFLSKIELKRGPAPTMAARRRRLFIATSHITADAAEHLGLSRDRTVITGSQVDV